MREMRNYFLTPSNLLSNSTFGGNIYNYDYEGYNSMSDITSRIISDLRFDEQCRKNTINRKERKVKNA